MNSFVLALALPAGITLCVYAGSTTLAPTSIQEIARGAEVIAEGQIKQVKSQPIEPNLIFTIVSLEVIDPLKGPADLKGKTVELRFSGGTFGDRSVIIPGLHVPRVNEYGVYFVQSMTRRLVNPLQGWDRGRFLIRPSNGSRRVFTADGRPVVGLEFGVLAEAAPQSSYVAAGVRTARDDAAAIPVDLFKDQIRSFLQNLRAR